MKKINLQPWLSRAWLGMGASLLAAVAVQASTDVTFMIDMGSENPGGNVFIAGSFNGWPYQSPATALINTSGTIWSNTFTITDAPGTIESCKFQDITTGWEPLGNNRQFILGSGTQVLPLTSWNANSTWPPGPTNQVTFQIDLTPEVVTGAFTNGGTGSINVSGDYEAVNTGYNNWDGGIPLTNNPTTGDYTSNFYTGTFSAVGFPGGTTINYKFRMNGGWESPSSTAGGNRTATLNGNSPSQVLPLVYYQDNTIYDLTSPIMVKFSVLVPDGQQLANGGTFTKGVDNVAVNGDWIPWWGWGVNAAPAFALLTEVGNSDVYTNTLAIPGGNSLTLTYKYGVDGLDNENGFATNHVRVIRGNPPLYEMPQDIFSWNILQPNNGNPYPLAGIAVTNIIEPSFGYLNIGKLTAGSWPITWYGRRGVDLQNTADLGAAWNFNNAIPTAYQTNNWPNTSGNQFFRLIKKSPAPGSAPSTW